MAEERNGGGTPWRVERAAAWVICLAAAVLGAWLLLKYALGVLMPFLLAYLLAVCIRPAVGWAAEKGRIPRGLVAAVLVVMLVGSFLALLAWGCGRAVSELEGLMVRLGQGDTGFGVTLTEVQDWMRSVSSHLPFLKRFEHTPDFAAFCDRLDAWVWEAANSGLTALGRWASGAVMTVVGGIPASVLFVTVLLLSCYYFAADDGSLGRAVTHRLPHSVHRYLSGQGARGRSVLRRYLRSYLILAAVTFAEMFLGLSMIGMPYAFLMAIVIALVDLLPLLGAGAVLIPWAMICFMTGDPRHAVGLLILWAVTAAIRQFLEPKLVSRGLGLHPLASLVAMYGGLRLFGVTGLLLCPLLVSLIKTLAMPSAELTEEK